MRGEENVYQECISLKNYFKEVRKLEMLGAKEQTELAIQARGGDQQAMKRLIESNLRFVLKVAREYSYTGLALEDLIQEGNLGIIKAVDRFDETKGFNFISYAVWWIRQSILQSTYDNGNSVRLPVNRINAVNKVMRASESLSKELGREPSPEEVVEYYRSIDTGESLLTEKDVRNAYVDSIHEVSLNTTFSEESGAIELHEFIEGTGLEEMEIDMNRDSLKFEIEEVLDELSNRESTILKMYFGIGNNQEMTLSEIGEKIGITNERVRQIKEFALKKLRTYNNSSKLKEFLSCDIR